MAAHILFKKTFLNNLSVGLKAVCGIIALTVYSANVPKFISCEVVEVAKSVSVVSSSYL